MAKAVGVRVPSPAPGYETLSAMFVTAAGLAMKERFMQVTEISNEGLRREYTVVIPKE